MILCSRYNLGSFEKPSFYETEEGFLHIKGNILKAEHFMDYKDKKGVLREKIPKDILFNESTKKSFMNKKITLEHPLENGKLTMINNENVNKFGKGTIIDVFENGDCLGATLQVEDKQTVDFIKERHRKGENIELSAGYSANVEHLKDNEYIQKDIKANHIAILTGKGRAGSDVKLIYNYLDYKEEEMKLKFNGKELTAEELLSETIELQSKFNKSEEEKKQLENEKEGLQKEKEKLEEDLEKSKEENEENKKKLNSLLFETKIQEIKRKAKNVLNSMDEKEDVVKIMEKVIKAANPKFNSQESDTIETLEDKFNFSIDVLMETNKKAKEDNKFNSEERHGLSLQIDNGYFLKKRNGGNK